MQAEKLSGKIKIILDPRKARSVSEKKKRYYAKYAFLVSETLKEPLFQKFLQKILKKEKVKMDEIRAIRIKTFPLKNKKGNSLAGKCRNNGVIYIYPKNIRFFQKLTQKWKKEKFKDFIMRRARAALIHELLHIKYLEKEQRVRKLTRKYFEMFIRLNPDANKETRFTMLPK